MIQEQEAKKPYLEISVIIFMGVVLAVIFLLIKASNVK